MLDSDDTLSGKRICCKCVGEPFLSEEIKQSGEIGPCAYCAGGEKSYSIEELADCVEAAFEEHFQRTLDQPTHFEMAVQNDPESNYSWTREGQPIVEAIEETAQIPHKAAEDIQEILEDRHADFEADKMGEEAEFSSNSYYAEVDSNDWTWQDEWHNFEEALKKEARFFSRIGVEHLTSVFGEIDKLKAFGDRPLVIEAGPEFPLNHVYRARVFQADSTLEDALRSPDRHLGAPPHDMANAGRMNAHGISVFYGATEGAVAIAEVRPPVGSKVVVAKFNITRQIRLLDLTALESAQDSGSVFDRTLKLRLERAAFLRSLSQHIMRPIMPNDESFDYLPTQAIADFLATENEPVLDGIVFRSAQSGDGLNVVLFHKAARVAQMQLPEGTEVYVGTGTGTDEGWESYYWVSEAVPDSTEEIEANADSISVFMPSSGQHYEVVRDFREHTLQVDPESVEVHHVERVRYECTAHKVDRHRYTKRDPKF